MTLSEAIEMMKRNAWSLVAIWVICSLLFVLVGDNNSDEKFSSESELSSPFGHQMTNCTNSSVTSNTTDSSTKWKLLVPGATWFKEDKDWNEYLINCDHKCVYSLDSRLIPMADAVLFHYNLPWETLYYNFSAHGRLPHQRFVSFSLESPLSLSSKFGSSYKDLQIDFYNWTLSYRSNQRIVYPYGKMIAANSTAIDPERLRNITSRKKTTAVWIASHCTTFSKREQIVQKLKNHNVKIDVWGDCGSKNICPRKDESICEQRVESDYFFFLAFENSICTEYVTEKLWLRASKFYTVPVVLNRKIAEDVGFPGDGLIAVDDFPTIAELGAFLLKLQSNLTEYERYFAWKSRHRIVEGSETAWCDLCAHLWNDKEPRSIVHDATKVFQNTSECFIPQWI